MPTMPVRPFRKEVDNAFIMNAIRKNASSDYQRRIPEATKANIQQTMNDMLNYTPARNEFISALINRIGLEIIRPLNWSNPLGKFKRGMLDFGDTIEEVQAGLVSSYVYDPDRDELERAIFGQNRPNVQSSIHKINRQEYYKITINQDMLKRAFINDTGLISLVNELMNVPNVSDQHDEFLAMTSLFRAYDDAEGFFRVNVPNISNLDTSDQETARVFTKKIRAYAENLAFLTPYYNASGMHVAAPRDKLELFITPEANASVDVDSLAAAFNVDRADLPAKTTIIPRENFNMPNVQAILSTSDFFVVADTLYETRAQPNPVGLYDNYFLHHHQILSASRFVPAVAFTTDPGTVINISNTPVDEIGTLLTYAADLTTVVTDVTRGLYHQVTGEAVTDPAGGFNNAIRLEVVGALSPRTYITNTGSLHIALDEAATNIKIRATSVDDQSIVAEITRPVIGDLLRLWPDPEVPEDPENP